MINNKLSLHSGKTEIMLVGSKTKLKNVDNFNITCLGQENKGSKVSKIPRSSIGSVCLRGANLQTDNQEDTCKAEIHVQTSEIP